MAYAVALWVALMLALSVSSGTKVQPMGGGDPCPPKVVCGG